MVKLEAYALIRAQGSDVVVLNVQHASGDATFTEPLQASQRDFNTETLLLKSGIHCNHVYLAQLCVAQRSVGGMNFGPAERSNLRKEASQTMSKYGKISAIDARQNTAAPGPPLHKF
jgi:hypothetical protein